MAVNLAPSLFKGAVWRFAFENVDYYVFMAKRATQRSCAAQVRF
jgi:hypothetical protein